VSRWKDLRQYTPPLSLRREMRIDRAELAAP
jgi:hypothetical protein